MKRRYNASVNDIKTVIYSLRGEIREAALIRQLVCTYNYRDIPLSVLRHILLVPLK